MFHAYHAKPKFPSRNIQICGLRQSDVASFNCKISEVKINVTVCSKIEVSKRFMKLGLHMYQSALVGPQGMKYTLNRILIFRK